MDQVARMGANWYSRANQGLFDVPKPIAQKGIGIDQIPPHIRNSEVLTGNDLGMLGNIEALPSPTDVDAFAKAHPEITSLSAEKRTHKARLFLKEKNVDNAWKVLLAKL